MRFKFSSLANVSVDNSKTANFNSQLVTHKGFVHYKTSSTHRRTCSRLEHNVSVSDIVDLIYIGSFHAPQEFSAMPISNVSLNDARLL